MKFDYTTTDRDPKEAVAWVDEDGDFVIFDADGSVCLAASAGGCLIWLDGVDTEAARNSAQRLFFPGDKVTITF